MKLFKKKKIALTIITVLCVAILGITLYTHQYYHATKASLACVSEKTTDHYMAFVPEQPTCGFIFYPGGKVEYEAYAPLMKALSEHDILCVLVHMPANLAFLDISSDQQIQKDFHEIKHWYLGGHSLGGAMSAIALSKHPQDYDGLILLASYSTKDFHDTNLRVLSIYGSEDKVLKMDSYTKNRTNLPSSAIEHVIKGGCHSYFGCYGIQDKDGKPTISNKMQIEETVEQINMFLQF